MDAVRGVTDPGKSPVSQRDTESRRAAERRAGQAQRSDTAAIAVRARVEARPAPPIASAEAAAAVAERTSGRIVAQPELAGRAQANSSGQSVLAMLQGG
jgi:hypothetical protein